jgi:hypothetical protein
MSAYAVVGPTNRKPRFFSALAIAVDSGVNAGTEAKPTGRAGLGGGANDHSSFARPSGSSAAARAFAIAASIFARLRTMPTSASRRVCSASPYVATRSMSNPSNAARNASRLRRMVNHDSPDWNASSVIFSKRRLSSRTGRPHSRS